MLLQRSLASRISHIERYIYSKTVPTCSRAASSSRHQLRRNRTNLVLFANQDEGPMGEDLTDFMKQDLERFAQKQPAARRAAEQTQQAPSSPVKDVVDKVLIADFFFVLLVLAWLGAGLAEKSTLKSSMLIDAWMPLWPMVFQPAIGILMAGALVSGGINWLAEQQQQKLP